jgi:Ni2+-binding GTPase involved in maturation of urease and hydrogenase
MALDSVLYPTTPGSTATTPAAAVTGTSNYSTFELYNNNEIEIFDTSAYANGSKFLTMLTRFGRARNAGNFNELGIAEKMITNYPEIRYKEQDKETDTFNVNAAAAAGTAGANMTVVFTSTAGLCNSMLLRCQRTNEILRIVSVDSGTNVTATRKVGDATNVALTTSDVFLLTSTAVAHTVSSLVDIGAPGVDRVNYVQKFVETVELTDENMFTSKAGGDNKAFVERRLNQAMYGLRLQIERAALFGEKFTGTDSVSGKSFYTTEGAIAMARRGWTDDISGSLTTKLVEETLGVTTQYMAPGSDTKFLILGAKAKSAINSLYTGRIARESIADIKEQVETITIGSGRFVLLQSPFMNASSGYEKHALVVDPGYFKVCYPTGTNLEGQSVDGKAKFQMEPTSTYANQKGSVVAYMGFQNANANAAALIKVAA